MGRPEARIEDYLIARVKETGGLQRKLKWVGRDGAPDRIVWYTFPQVGLIEVKREGGGRLDPAQAREMAVLHLSGWPVFLVASRDDVDAALNAINARTP
jgi:hypothetical protein